MGGIDEVFQRTDSSGGRSFLTDALGSSIALADSTGTIQTQYTFDPFGKTTPSGASTTNSFAYTGRELDPTGLYFNRARYYHPTIQRFIAEDPLAFGGGDVNFYAYVGNDPVNGTDPSGMKGCFYVASCGDRRPLPRFLPPPIPPPVIGRKPKDAAAQYCRDNGQLAFNVPIFGHEIPVTISASATGFFANFSSTGDISSVIPLMPGTSEEPFNLGASIDITINAPPEPIANPSVGLGRHLGIGYFPTANGPQGVSLSVGPSVGPPVNVTVPVNNVCAMAANN